MKVMSTYTAVGKQPSDPCYMDAKRLELVVVVTDVKRR